MEITESEITAEREDVKYLKEQLEQTHYDLYRNVSEQVLSDTLQKATEVDPEFFSIAIQESLALIKDAHTYTEGILNGNYLPIGLREIDGQFYIIGSSEEYKSLLGQKLIGINGHNIVDITNKVSNLSSKENDEVLKSDLAKYIIANQVLRYYGFSSSNQLQIATNKGNTKVTVDTETKVKQLHPLRWKDIEINDPSYIGNSIYQFRIIGDTLLFQYNKCTNKDYSEEELAEFKRKLLETADSVKSIVVDLRENRGGNTGIMEDLFEKFPENKEIYVAMGRDTFSSAMHHLLYLKNTKKATLLGDNAGEKPNRFGDHKDIVLPNSKIKIGCSYKYFQLLPGQDIEVVQPDIKIPLTIEDYINNTDPLNQWIKDNL